MLVSPQGNVVTNYRKTFLFTTDETWATEGQGFFAGDVPGIGNMAMGICMFLPNLPILEHITDLQSRHGSQPIQIHCSI